MRRLAFLLLLICFQTATAQTYPNRPVKIVIGFTPGGGVDINARLLAAKLSEILGQSVIVENKPGAGTNIAAEFVARSAADGYTLFFNSPAMAINMSLYKNPGYDIVKDFAPVSVFSDSTNILVVPASMKDDQAYTILKTLWEAHGDLVATHKASTDMTPENQKEANSSVPFHPGAVKFFAEKGIKLS